MPGLLKPSAKCPMCGDGLTALVDTTSSTRVRREFFHEKHGAARRRRPCVKLYFDYRRATRERRVLEARAA